MSVFLCVWVFVHVWRRPEDNVQELWVLGIEFQPSDSVGSAGQVQLPLILFVNPGTGLQTPVILFTIVPAEPFLQPSSSLQKGEAGI